MMFNLYGWKRTWPACVNFFSADTDDSDNGLGGYPVNFAEEMDLDVDTDEVDTDDNEDKVNNEDDDDKDKGTVDTDEDKKVDDDADKDEDDEKEDDEAKVDDEKEPTAEEQLVAMRAELELLKAKQNEPKQSKEDHTVVDDNGVIDYFDGIDKDELIEDADKLFEVFNNKLNEVRLQAVQHTFKAMPQMVTHYTTQQAAMNDAVKTFYENNPQLAGVKELVAQQVTSVGSEHPEWDMHEILKEVETKSYKLLGIKKQAASKEKSKKKPAFATDQKTRSTEKPPKKVAETGDAMADEISKQVSDFVS